MTVLFVREAFKRGEKLVNSMILQKCNTPSTHTNTHTRFFIYFFDKNRNLLLGEKYSKGTPNVAIKIFRRTGRSGDTWVLKNWGRLGVKERRQRTMPRNVKVWGAGERMVPRSMKA